MHTHRPPSQTVRRALAATLVAVSLTAVGGCGALAWQKSLSASPAVVDSVAPEVPAQDEPPAPTAAPAPATTEPAAQKTVLTPARPSRPVEMEGDGADGALAAAHYFLDSVRFAYFVGDTSMVEAMSSESCEGCWKLVDHVSQVHGEGYFLVFDDDVPLAEPIVAAFPDAPSTWIVTSSVDVGDAYLFDAATGVDVHTEPGATGRERVLALERTAEGWVVLAYNF